MVSPFTYDHEAMRAYRREGFTIAQVAKRFGCSTFTASKACRGAVPSVDLQRLACCRSIVKANAVGNARVRAARLRAAEAGQVYVPRRPAADGVPIWAKKAGLSDDYRDFAHNFDEIYAARVCRRLKAEASRQCP